MTVKELSENKGFSVVTLPEPERKIGGAYCGDLLSWVMGRAKADDAWVTIMTNSNIIAVASLADTACIILSEGVELDSEVKALAEEKGVNVLATNEPIYETAATISRLI